MGRGPKPAKSKEAKPPVARKSPKDDATRVRDLEKRLAEALRDKAEALKLQAEAQEQHAATAEVLRIISASPTDLQPVFDAMLESAVRLLGGFGGAILRYDGDLVHFAAVAGGRPQSGAEDWFRSIFPRQLEPDTPVGRAIAERRIIQVSDTEDDASEITREVARQFQFRAVVCVPMLRKDTAIGVISVTRAAPGEFSDPQIALLKTFADQAAIAIENTRLFNETKEAVEQQTATSEILRVISGSPTDVQPVFQAIAESAVRLCGGVFSTLISFDGELMRLEAAHNWTPEAFDHLARRILPAPPSRTLPAGRAILDCTVIHLPDIELDQEFGHQELTRAVGFRSILTVPMLHDGVPLGAISVARAERGPFSDNQITLLRTFADQAVIAIENVRLFTELQASNRELTTALDTQTATSDILRVISQSPTDIQPVFDTVVESAARLCEANDVSIYRRDGDWLRFVAHHGSIPPPGPVGEYFRPLERGSSTARSVLEGQMLHVADLQAETEEFPTGSDLARRLGFRTLLSIPLMQEGAAIGTIMVRRTEVRLFTERQVALLRTFANQAVIAIENVRLFKELEARNRDLTATGEILQVISRSPTDVQPVFNAIVRSGMRLLEGFSATVRRLVGDELHLAAFSTTSESGDEALKSLSRLALADDPLFAQAIRDRVPCSVSDTEIDPRVGSRRREVARARGYRGMLIVPMLHDDSVIGAITVTRREPGPFSDQHIALLQTFADQAVIAIENVRLFNETKEALDRQTATAEILRVIASSPTDLQPVFDTIVRTAVKLCAATFGGLQRIDGSRMTLDAQSGVSADELAILQRDVFPLPISHESATGRAVVDRAVVHIRDIREDPEFGIHRLQTMQGFRTILAVPMLRERVPIGALALWRREVQPFSAAEISLVQTFADQAVIAIENVRLFTELQEKNRALTEAHAQVTEALEQQTATSEILRVISRSPSDAQPVFDTILRSAVRLCDAVMSNVQLFDGELMHFVAQQNIRSEAMDSIRRLYPMRPDRSQTASRAILTRSVAHLPDVLDDREYRRELALSGGWRSVLSVPMIREGDPIGAITVARHQPGAFSDDPDRAAPNLRRPGGHRDRERAAAHRAAGTDAGPDSIGRATHGAGRGRAGGQLHARSRDGADHHRLTGRPAVGAGRRRGVRVRRGHRGVRPAGGRRETGGALARGSAHHTVPEGRRSDSDGPPSRWSRSRCPTSPSQAPTRVELRGNLIESGIRAILAVPMVREDRLIGCLAVTRNHPGEFPSETIELLADLRDAIGPGHPERPALPGDRREEPPARSRQPAQVRVPGQHVPRAANAAQRDHRLLGGPDGPHVRRAEREAGRVSKGHLRLGHPSAVPDQRHPRPLEDRGRADGAGTDGLPSPHGTRQRPDPGPRAGWATEHHLADERR